MWKKLSSFHYMDNNNVYVYIIYDILIINNFSNIYLFIVIYDILIINNFSNSFLFMHLCKSCLCEYKHFSLNAFIAITLVIDNSYH